MVDHLSPNSRSRLMASIKGRDTRPEIVVRKLAHALGFRYRLHRKDLPGTPDLVFVRQRKVILVHGCFWHRHPGCSRATTPHSNVEFWTSKLERNVERDEDVHSALVSLGWKVLVIWECETKNTDALKDRIARFLAPDTSP